jgi:predicted  nucleic acid-binding Zn-ribbon protein
MNTDDLAKYEAELAALNKKLQELEDNKTQILRQGFRIEGIVAYLRAVKATVKEEVAHVVEEAKAL